ncbi:MAG: hypothetical protein CM15mV22_2350 [Eurybiavirus sp.]|nr:MAG: hypothetical protein CM15mV22_2350 [Eurybiavirus sp.]
MSGDCKEQPLSTTLNMVERTLEEYYVNQDRNTPEKVEQLEHV